MFKLLIDTYIKISEESYYPFEIYHMHQASKHIDPSVSIRDVQMLFSIQYAKTPMSPSSLSKNFSLANNVISNRLHYFEELEFITRHRFEGDQRSVILTITNKGKEIVSSYTNYVNTFLKHLKKSLIPLDYLTMMSVLKKLSHIIKTKSKEDDDEIISSDFFMSLHNYFISFDLNLIEELNYNLKVNDFVILTEYYLQTLNHSHNVSQLSNKILFPYQTLISKMNKFHDMHLLEHDANSHFVLTKEALHIVETFMTSRVIVYYQTLKSFSEKELALIAKNFKTLKEYSK
jgi:DNA-binding MarR family transcriptional regulator